MSWVSFLLFLIFHYHLSFRVEYCIQTEIRYILHLDMFELTISWCVFYSCIIYTTTLQPCPQLVFS